MEYVQMTLNDWAEMKQALERELNNIKTGFVRVGYVLRKIEESKAYEQDGYASIAEFAQKEYGLSPTSTSRFMAINAKFSIDGFSERLDPQYTGFRQAALIEMLTMDEDDISLITPQTKRDDIRALKDFNREAPQAEAGESWIRDMMAVTPDDLVKELAKARSLGQLSGRYCAEILNPGGNRMVRTKTAMIAMTDDGLIVKTFGPDGGRKSLSWQEYAGKLDALFDSGEISTAAEGGAELAEREKTEDLPPAEGHAPEEKPAVAEGQYGKKKEHPDPEKRKPVAPVQIQSEKPEKPIEEPAEKPADEADEETVEEAEPVAPTPDIPQERMPEYIQALGDARRKLDEIEKQLQESDWNRMSDSLLSLGFIVNQLKVISALKAE